MKAFIVLLFVLQLTSVGFAGPTELAYESSYSAELRGDWDRAVKALMPLYEKYPDGYTLNYRLGWLFFNKGAFANAEFHFKKSFVTFPSAIENRLVYAKMLLAQGRWAEIEQVALVIIKKDYYNYQANLALTQSLLKQQKGELAVTVNYKMLALFPTDTRFLKQLGLSLMYVGDTELAKKAFNDLLVLDPANEAAQAALARITADTSPSATVLQDL